VRARELRVLRAVLDGEFACSPVVGLRFAGALLLAFLVWCLDLIPLPNHRTIAHGAASY
jgi:hypothetical protein